MGEWDNYCDEIGGICKDMEAQDARIAELEKENRKLLIDYENRLCEARKYQRNAVRRCEELGVECDRLRKALKEILNCEVVMDTGDYSKGNTGFDCNEVKEIVFKTLKGKPHDR